jgi:hypothetical protein
VEVATTAASEAAKEELMRLYSGIDLHSTNNYIAILDQHLETVGQRKLPNDLEQILAYLEPHREELAGVAVESTFN